MNIPMSDKYSKKHFAVLLFHTRRYGDGKKKNKINNKKVIDKQNIHT